MMNNRLNTCNITGKALNKVGVMLLSVIMAIFTVLVAIIRLPRKLGLPAMTEGKRIVIASRSRRGNLASTNERLPSVTTPGWLRLPHSFVTLRFLFSLKKITFLGLFSLLISCDGSDCIDPADFGNLVVKSFKIDSNPFDENGYFKVNDSPGTSYSAYSKNCNVGSNISSSSKVYHWLDTGIDIVSDRHNLSLKVSGAVNFCAPQITSTVNEDGQDVADFSDPECNEAQTLVFAHILSGQEQDMYSATYETAADYQPLANVPSCSKSEPTSSSTYYVDDHNDFVIIIPRVKKTPYKTDSDIEDEVDTLIANMASTMDLSGQRDLIEAQLRRANSHSISGQYTALEYKQDEDKILNSPTESVRTSWYSRGQNVMVKLFDTAGNQTHNLGELAGGSFDHNPAPPSNVSHGGRQTCCMEYNSNGSCDRWDTESNRGYFEIDLDDPDSNGIDTDMYNYCEKDVFRYTGGNVEGYVKFKIEEDFQSCSRGNGAYCHCGGDTFHGSKPSTCFFNDIVDGIADLFGSDIWGDGAGCYEKECCGFSMGICVGAKKWVFSHNPTPYSTYHDNYGVYSITTKSPKSCIGKYETVEFRIGDDITGNKRILTEDSFYDIPWNVGRLYVRVIDQKILEQDSFDLDQRECYWTQGGSPDISDLRALFDNNHGKFTITVRTVEQDEAITRLKDVIFEQFGHILIADSEELVEMRESFEEERADLQSEVGSMSDINPEKWVKLARISTLDSLIIKYQLDSQGRTFRERYFDYMVEDIQFQNILSIMVVLYVAFTAIAFVMGVVNINQHELLMRVIKIGIIYTLLSPGSWQFFSYLINIFERGAEDIAVLLAGSFMETEDAAVVNNIYSLLDEIVYVFFQPEIHQKISAIFFSPILVGIVLFFFTYYAMFLMLYAVAKSIIIYLVIKLIFAILFMVAPIFITFSLFDKTKQVFEQWLNMVISYSMQLIFLFLCVAFFSYLILNIFYDLFYYGVCWKPVWIIKLGELPEFEFFSFWRFHGFDNRYSETYNVSRGPDITSVLFFLVVAFCFKQIIEKITDLGNAVAGYGGVGAGTMASQMIKDGAGAIGDAVKGVGKNVAAPIAGTALNAAWKASTPARMAISAPGEGLNKLSRSATQKFMARQGKSDAWEKFNKASPAKKGAAEKGWASMKSAGRSFSQWKNSGHKMARLKDAMSSGMLSGTKSNSDFLDFKGRAQRAIGAGSLRYDKQVMKTFDKAVSKGFDDAKKRGLSPEAAKEYATKYAEKQIDKLDLLPDRLDSLKAAAKRKIDKKEVGYIGTSGLKDRFNASSFAKAIGYDKMLDSNTAMGLIKQNRDKLQKMDQNDSLLRDGIAKTQEKMPMNDRVSRLRASAMGEFDSFKEEEERSVDKRIEKMNQNAKDNYNKTKAYRENAFNRKVESMRQKMLHAPADKRPAMEQSFNSKVAEMRKEKDDLLRQFKNSQERALKYNIRKLQEKSKEKIEKAKIDNEKDLEKRIAKTLKEGLTKDELSRKRELEAERRYYKSQLNSSTEERLEMSKSLRILARDQVLKSAEELNKKAKKLAEETNMSPAQISKKLEKDMQKQVEKLEKMYKDSGMDFGKSLTAARENSDRYVQLVDEAIERDKEKILENYKKVTGDEFVRKKSGDDDESDDDLDVNIERDRDRDDDDYDNDRQDALDRAKEDKEARKLSQDARNRIPRIRSRIQSRQSMLRNAVGAERARILKQIRDLEQEILELEQYLTEE